MAGATATAVALLAACGEDSEGSASTDTTGADTPTSEPTGLRAMPASEPNAFRLSSRHVKKPCNACLAHNRNRYYATPAEADADRPHDGCNCEVRGQVIADAEAASYFSAGRTMFEKRSG